MLEEGQVIGAAGVDNVVSHNNCAFPHCSQTLQVLKISQVKILEVIDEDHIESSVLLYKRIFGLNCPHVDFDSVSHTCVLVDSAGYIGELDAGIDCVDDGVGGMGHDE